jgi:hypothetical protein
MVMTKERKQEGKRAAPVKPAEKMTKEDMEMAAYFHWLGRGCPSDDSLTDWIQVEKKWGKDAISKTMEAQA